MQPTQLKVPSSNKIPTQSSKKLPIIQGTLKNTTSGKQGITKKTKAKVTTTTTNQTDEREIILIDGISEDVTPLPLIFNQEEVKIERKDESERNSVKTISIIDKKEESVTGSLLRVDKSDSVFRSSDHSEANSVHSDDTEKEKPAEEPKDEFKGIKEEDLDKLIDIDLSETETQTIFFILSTAVSAKAENREEIDKINSGYKTLLKDKLGSDNFKSRPSQTLNFMRKSKDITTDIIKPNNFQCDVTSWMLHDSFLENPKPAHELVASNLEKEVKASLAEQLKNRGTLLDPEKSLSDTYHSVSISQTQITNKDTASSKMKSSKRIEKSTHSIHSSSSVTGSKHSHESSKQESEVTAFKSIEDVVLPDTLLNKFNIVERILTQNRYLEQQISYRNYPTVEFAKFVEQEKTQEKGLNSKFDILKKKKENEKKEEVKEEEVDKDNPHIVDLFKYTCSEVTDRMVTCADWNSLNKDLLAVSYGEYDSISKKPGMLLFWTLKSPKFPERIIKADSGLISCHFSKINPNLIATGSCDGVVAIYDVRKKGDKPAAESSQMLEKHIDTVWEVKWHDQGNEKGENLISISSDGRIVEWSIKKGLECKDLLNLKKPTNPNQKDDKEAAVFRSSVGFSLDFPKDQYMLYLASTEEGTIHKCSLSYNDELDTYWGHSGPVYKVRCSPFWSNIMLTCSADWTVQLWDWRRDETPLFSCRSQDLNDAVNDIEWSPNSSTIFSCVCDDGRVEIWDLDKGNIGPIITKKPEARGDPGTMVRFCQEFPVLVTGNSKGVVDVYRVKNLNQPLLTKDEHKKRLEKAVYPTDKDDKHKGDEEEEEMEGNVD
jgi:dynein intermediate chain 4, axonemal